VTLRSWAPGRVTLVGDHTDHTGGLALTMAIGLGIELWADRASDWIILGSQDMAGVAELPLTIEDPSKVEPGWARYVAAVARELRPTDGLTGTLASNLPIGRGLSSSAALEVAVAAMLGANLADPVAVAQLCRRAEHRAVGVLCGIMDQLTILAAVEDRALRIDCHDAAVRAVELPEGAEVAIVDSGQHRELETSQYGTRRAECGMAEGLIGALRLATPADAETIDDPLLQRRARHVTTENQRVDAMVAAFAADDLRSAGQLMAASHASLRDDFEVSTPELDVLVSHLRGIPGVFGARLTGAGFGGCVVALCTPGTRLDVPVVWRGRPAAGAFLAEA
jgi:galactokinase